jgi:hypothetical protein
MGYKLIPGCINGIKQNIGVCKGCAGKWNGVLTVLGRAWHLNIYKLAKGQLIEGFANVTFELRVWM